MNAGVLVRVWLACVVGASVPLRISSPKARNDPRNRIFRSRLARSSSALAGTVGEPCVGGSV